MPLENHEAIDLLKDFPRKELDLKASQRILHHLRQSAQQKMLGSRQKRHLCILAVMTAVALVLAIPFVPVLRDKAEQGLTRLFPPTNSQIWSISPLFDLQHKDGTIIYPNRVRGIEGKIGFLEGALPFVANASETGAKIFWYVWGIPDNLSYARLVATAVNAEKGTKFILNDTMLQGPFYGADAHSLTNFKAFPHKGIWRIDVKINDEYFGSIVVPVKDEYIHTTHTRFLVSKDDVTSGDIDSTLVISGHNLEQTIEIRAYPLDDKENVRTFIFEKNGEFTTASFEPITHYSGLLRFDRTGDWQVEVLGEKTKVRVKS